MPHQTLSQIGSHGKIEFLNLDILLGVGKVSLTSSRNNHRNIKLKQNQLQRPGLSQSMPCVTGRAQGFAYVLEHLL